MSESDIFKVLSDKQRRDILELLKDGRKSAGEIASILDTTPQALSYHLKLLKNSNLVLEYKIKNFIYYELNLSILDETILWITNLRGGQQ